MSDSPELLKPNAEVTDGELQIEIGDLKAENEILKAQFLALLDSSNALAKELLQQAEMLLVQLETVQADNRRLQRELSNSEAERQEFSQELAQLETERADRKEIEVKLSGLKQNSAPDATLSEKLIPDAATILSQLRARRKKSKTDLADVEAILEILES